MTRLIIQFLLLLPALALGKTIEVCSTCPQRSIVKAIASSTAYDTVIINGGTYSEGNILIEKPLVIIGKKNPVIDGRKKAEVITVRSNNVKISGLTITNSGNSSLQDLAGIKIHRGRHVVIAGNTLKDNTFGIYLASSSDCEIRNNTVTASGTGQQSSGNGIHLWKCNNVLISKNKISGHRDGIYFEFVTSSRIEYNHSELNLRYGLHFMFSDNDTYEGNTFKNNGAGVAVMYTKNVKMYRNTFQLNWGSGSYAILLKDIRDSEIIGNTFNGNTTGISAEGASRVKIEGNQFIQNGWALKITSSCDELNITRNNFSGNTFDMATNGTSNVTVNKFDGNYWDKYQGYDLDRNNIGEVPYHPMSLSTLLVEKIPASVYFLHSFILDLIDQSEKLIPSLTPSDLKDNAPSMKKFAL